MFQYAFFERAPIKRNIYIIVQDDIKNIIYFCSYDNNIKSNYQLGSWTCNSNQLRLKYRFLYSPALKEIYYKQGKTIINWFAKDERRTAITKNTDSQDFTTSIPAMAHPIKYLNNDSFYIMRNTDQPTTITPTLSLIDYIESKPPWYRRLIGEKNRRNGIRTIKNLTGEKYKYDAKIKVIPGN